LIIFTAPFSLLVSTNLQQSHGLLALMMTAVFTQTSSICLSLFPNRSTVRCSVKSWGKKTRQRWQRWSNWTFFCGFKFFCNLSSEFFES